ncbi:hypothetical protein DesyoDRAFT_2696 [Desulfosporosinus youngiae DSM 17734]|uniref:DUF4367 domain-containing protein n=2 Tax=Desulfosporosinus TaxID=79206 RepID=H5Y475_9FIRM|nr:hypothetical protein DesyoDRAFT_2696 [Desulfosporosinus youngiae DSM 17734]
MIILASIVVFFLIMCALIIFPLNSKTLSANDQMNYNIRTNNVVHAENSGGGKTMSDLTANPDGPVVVKAKQTDCNDFAEAQKLANFIIKAPQNIPDGFRLVFIQHIRPDLPKIAATAKNDTVSAVYSNGNAQFNIIQGHFSGGDVPVGPEGSAHGTVEIAGVQGKWVKGGWNVVEEPSADSKGTKEWKSNPLDLGWYKDGIGYAILATGMELDDIVKLANSME